MTEADNFSDPEYEPYALAIGKFVLNWNFLQSALCELFGIVTLEAPPAIGSEVNLVPINIWHSLNSDRAQLAMLGVAIASSHLRDDNNLVKDGEWLCERVNSLEDRRNDIMHSALILMRHGTEKTEVMANYFSRHPRAKKLGKVANLLEEIQSCARNASLLTDYTSALTNALITTRAPWPKRPVLQGRQLKETPANQSPARHK